MDHQHPLTRLVQQLQRRCFLRRSAGIGSLALGTMLADDSNAGLLESGGVGSALPHVAPSAKSVIFLHMTGAPSHLDLFDHKPVLKKFDRQEAPAELYEGKRFSFLRGQPRLLGSPYRFRQYGDCGMEFSELLPNLAGHADDLCMIRSMTTTEFNHGPAQMVFHTGMNRQGYPSLGSWATYGLGSESQDLPGYVVFLGGATPGGGSSLWKSGFLPSVYQGIQLRGDGDPVLFLNSPGDVSRSDRRATLDAIRSMNEQNFQATQDPEIQTRIEQYELAFRMQTSVPELVDLSEESKQTLEMYGDTEFGKQCLTARRLAERGVRFIEFFKGDWDTHSGQHGRLTKMCRDVDQPISALLTDLKQRGLLEQTLVVWGAEFGRTPMLQGDERPSKCGRDHQKDAYSIWMAGGGIKPGITYGRTNELGNEVVENPTNVRDVHATMLQLLGLNHEQLTYRYQGLDQKLTGVEEAHVLKQLLQQS